MRRAYAAALLIHGRLPHSVGVQSRRALSLPEIGSLLIQGQGFCYGGFRSPTTVQPICAVAALSFSHCRHDIFFGAEVLFRAPPLLNPDMRWILTSASERLQKFIQPCAAKDWPAPDACIPQKRHVRNLSIYEI